MAQTLDDGKIIEATVLLTHQTVLKTLKCSVCGQVFDQRVSWQKVCSKKCSKDRKRLDYQEAIALLREKRLQDVRCA